MDSRPSQRSNIQRDDSEPGWYAALMARLYQGLLPIGNILVPVQPPSYLLNLDAGTNDALMQLERPLRSMSLSLAPEDNGRREEPETPDKPDIRPYLFNVPSLSQIPTTLSAARPSRSTTQNVASHQQQARLPATHPAPGAWAGAFALTRMYSLAERARILVDAIPCLNHDRAILHGAGHSNATLLETPGLACRNK